MRVWIDLANPPHTPCSSLTAIRHPVDFRVAPGERERGLWPGFEFTPRSMILRNKSAAW
jgi:hypothetical protein